MIIVMIALIAYALAFVVLAVTARPGSADVDVVVDTGSVTHTQPLRDAA